MTWKSHCVANGAVAFALTGRLEIVAAAMATATLPDQLEVLLPFGRHRGATHWVALWLAVILTVPCYAQRELTARASAFLGHTPHGWPTAGFIVGALAFGLTLGPFLHVLFDGCSDSGVPVLPFSNQKLKLGLYRTQNFRWWWDPSEALFLSGLIAVCAVFCRIHGWPVHVL